MPFAADAVAAQQVQDRLKSLQQLIHEIEKKRFQSEQGINTLQKYAQDDKSGQSSQVNITFSLRNVRRHFFVEVKIFI